MASVELASAYVVLIPSLKGAAGQISKQLGGVNVAPVGQKLGAQLSAGISSSLKSRVSEAVMRPVSAALERQADATRSLGAAERELSKARAAQQTAQANVLRAEERLQALRASGKTSSTDLVKAEAELKRLRASGDVNAIAKAEERLAQLRASGRASSGDLAKAEADLNQAKVALADTNIRVGTAEDALSRSKESAADASKAYADAVKDSESQSARLRVSLPIIGDHLQSVGARFQQVGSQISGVGSSLTSKITKPALAATGVVAGLVGALGFKRLVGIDTARGQFKGLGHDAEAVMEQVDKGVQNTALSMAEGAQIAVAILATGNVPLKELESQLRRVANVSAAYGVDSAQAGYLLNNVLTKNKVTYGDLSQMVRNQIPIISDLAKYYGVAGDEIEKMAQDGKISIEDLNTVLDQNAGAAAEEYSNTWKGVTSNILANIGRLGAEVLGGVFSEMKVELQGFLDILKSDNAKQFAQDVGVGLAEAFTKVSNAVKAAVDWWSGLSPEMKKTIGVAAGVAVALGPVLMVVGRLVSGIGSLVAFGGRVTSFFGGAGGSAKLLGGALRVLTGPIGLVVGAIVGLLAVSPELREAFQKILAVVGGAFQTVFEKLAPIFEQVAAAIAPVVSALADALVPVFEMVAEVLGPIIEVIGEVIGALLEGLAPAIEFLAPVVTTIFEGIAETIGSVMNIIKAIITTVTALIKGDWKGAWEGVKQIGESVWNAIKTFISTTINAIAVVVKTVVDGVKRTWQSAWNTVKSVFTSIWNSIVSAATGFLNSVKSKFNSVMTFIGTIPGKIKGFFSGIGSWLVDSGRSLIQGFIDGITGAFNGAKEAVSNGLQAIRDLFPFSPAKEGPFSGRGWVAYSGVSIGETFTASIADSLRDGRRDIADELDDIQDDFDSFNDPSFRVAGARFDGSRDVARWAGPQSLTVVDSDGALVGRMRVEASSVLVSAVPSRGGFRAALGR